MISFAESSLRDWLAREKMCGSFREAVEVIFRRLGSGMGWSQMAG